MKKRICLMVLGIGVVLFFYGISKRSGSNGWNITRQHLSGQKVSQVQSRKNNEEMSSHRKKNVKIVRPRVYKPISLQVGQGGATVVEIDHGLTPVNLLGGERYSDDVQRGKRKGATGAITLRVVDTTGAPVAGAELFGGFWNNNPDDPPATGTSDANGELSVKGLCTGDFNFQITKDGYYKTSLRYWFFKNGFDCAKDGRWLPWNPTVEVILKRKINPVAMYVRPNREGLTPLVPPVKNKYIGFDLEKGDWVNPYGKGICSDFNLKYEYEAGMVPLLHYRGAVFFSFTNKHDGAYVMNKDVFSLFSSLYQAETNALYQQEFAFVYDRLSGDTTENTKFSESEYLVIRTRSKTDENGNLISAHYSKMYGPISAGGGGVYMGFYFNPNKNDSNLEADTTQNLLNPNDLGFTP